MSRTVRAFNPWPVAFTKFDEKNLRIWLANAVSEKTGATPGTVLAESRDGIDVATGDGILRVTQLQMPGGKSLSAEQFLNAHSLLGVQFGASE